MNAKNKTAHSEDHSTDAKNLFKKYLNQFHSHFGITTEGVKQFSRNKKSTFSKAHSPEKIQNTPSLYSEEYPDNVPVRPPFHRVIFDLLLSPTYHIP